MPEELRVHGSATLYRLYDVGYAIALDRAAELLGDSTRGRVRPGRGEARAIEIRSPPLFALLGTFEMTVGAAVYPAALSAHMFDFGVCSLRLQVVAAPSLEWSAFAEFGNAFDTCRDADAILARELPLLLERIAPAVERPGVAPQSEDYSVYRIDRIEGREGRRDGPVSLLFADAQLVRLLLGERRPLSAPATRELLPHRFSYHDDDLAVLSWESALVVEPRAEDFDVEYVLEFANAQLLELRVYDAQLDAELPSLYDRVALQRARRGISFRGRFQRVLGDLQTRVADITETVERAENALKVTNDVYLARLYAAALELFREQAWRRGIERKLGILRETYAMLNSETQAGRAEVLEITIVVLILIELLLALVRGGS